MRISSVVLVCVSLLLPTAVNSATIILPQTGQTVIQSAGDDGDLRSGKVWPTPRFEKKPDGTIRDRVNGLIWSSDANLLASQNQTMTATVDGAVTWQSSLDQVQRLNGENYLGSSDWRLPNLNELASILNQGEPCLTEWLGQQGISNVQHAPYWTSTSVAINPTQAWVIDLATGGTAPNAKFFAAHVWPVRGGEYVIDDMSALPKTGQSACFDSMGKKMSCVGTGQDGELRKGIQWPKPRFNENSDGTVTDNLTGFVWLKNANLIALKNNSSSGSPEGRILWPDALEFVAGLNQAGYLGHTDWRLPNRNEMVSLINYAESDPTNWINTQGFSNPQQQYWSSGTSARTATNAWNISLAGDVSERNKYDPANGSFVWPMRGGIDTPPAVAPLTITKKTVQAAAATLAVSTSTIPDGTVGTGYSQTLAATGGTSPYTWSKKTGSLPAGLTLSTTGIISGAPSTVATSTFTVQVKDSKTATATKSLSITINAAPLTITTTAPADGYLTTAYNQTLTATGGKSSYGWAITTGKLPAGLSLAVSTGVISGTPTAIGVGSFTVQVKDATNATTTKALTITIYTLPSIGTASLSAGAVGTAYGQTILATGGKSAYTWSVSSGKLPAGLTLTPSTGMISGTPTTAGAGAVTFMVADANNKTSTKALSMVINAAPPAITTGTPADGYLTTAYSQLLTATGGKPPYSWSITTGAVPAGLSLALSTGVISGTPTVTGVGSFTVQVKDATNATTTKALTITIYTLPSIGTASLSTGAVGTAYSQTVVATGGKSTYTWSVSSGTLPAGLTLAPSTGMISGTPTATGAGAVTFMVADANNKTSTKALSIVINAAPLAITTGTPADGYLTTAYSQSLTSTGGTPPYSWSITTGTLPAGLSLAPSTGVISGTPTVTGVGGFTVQVKDADNSITTKSLAITSYPPLSITTVKLTIGYLGLAYNQTLTATGGKRPYSWSCGYFPAYGFSLDSSSGIISGIPTTQLWLIIPIEVRDANNVLTTNSLNLVVHTATTIDTISLPDGYVGTAYSQTMKLNTGVLPPFSWSVADGALPVGLSLDSLTGVISGMPTVAGINNFTVQALDQFNYAASKPLTITVCAPLKITTPVVTGGTVGSAYSQTLTAMGGKSPYTWSVIDSSIPGGLSLDSTGIISGTPAFVENGSFTLQARDANNVTAIKTFSMNITVSGSISGMVTDRDSKAPLPGVTVTLQFTGINSKNSKDRLYLCNDTPLLPSDYILAAADDGSRFACSSSGSNSQVMTFKEHNPFGTTDPFSITWTGIGVLAEDEYLAQGFKPTRSGILNKAMIMAPGESYDWTTGKLIYLQLKTALDGGRASLLAESDALWSKTSGSGTDELEFGFPTPATLTAGKQYYLVIKGRYTDPPYFKPMYWGGGTAQTNFLTYVRNAGIWRQTDSTLAFKTFIDNQPDAAAPYAEQEQHPHMGGDTDQEIKLSVLNQTTGLWEYGGTLVDSSNGDVTDNGDHFSFSRGDTYLTIQRTVKGTTSDYYDRNGWITVRVENQAARPVSQFTDRFSLTYNRTVTAVTDVNGAYSFTSLPEGSYTLTFEYPGYATNTDSGAVTPGQAVNRGSLLALAPVISTPTPLVAGLIGAPYTKQMTATVGLPPYKWSIVDGNLPAGLTLNTLTGEISGTPTVLGNSSFIVQVKDSGNAPATKSFTMTIISTGSIGGMVSDRTTGAPIPGTTVTLTLTGITFGDQNNRLYFCNEAPLTPTDYTTITANDSSKFSCLSGGVANTMLFKVRNPYGAESFTSRWNGMLATYYENLAQSFKPTGSGALSKVGFYLPQGISTAYYARMVGELHVQLKNGLGGDAGVQLAESSSVPIESLPVDVPQWVEFVFLNPANVTAGQEYYLEIQGRTQRGNPGESTWWQYQPEAVSWGNGMASAGTEPAAYRRRVGLWETVGHSLAFRTYMENNPDIALEPTPDGGSTPMYGVIEQYVGMSLLNLSTGRWDTGGSVAPDLGYLTHDTVLGGYSYRGDDLTIDWTNGAGFDRYFDPNGWLTVKMDNYAGYWDAEPPLTSLVTDQFNLSFNRAFSASTDMNGAYLFPTLPDGSYTLTFEKGEYATATKQGTLSSGQAITLTTGMAKAATATLQGIIRLSNSEPLGGVRVTVTTASGSNSAVSDNNGNYLVSGIVYGNYRATFEFPGLTTKTVTGSLFPGQAGVVDTWLIAVPITLTITSPADGAVISVTPLIVSGSVANADSVTVNVLEGYYENETMTEYPATIINGVYSASIPLQAGETRILVSASNRYHLNMQKRVTITTAQFTLRNLGDVGTVTVMEATGNYDARNPDGSLNDQPRQAIAGEYIRSNGDTTDFLVMLSTFDYAMPEATAKAFYSSVKNDTQGINQPLLDNTTRYGSHGMLQGTIDLGNVTTLAANPYGPKLEETTTNLNHELMHRFGAYVRFKNPDGSLNSGLLGKDSAHWSYLLDSKGSIMYGNGWLANGDGTFTSTAVRSGFSPLDLYLMGIIPKEQVPPMLLIDNPTIDKTLMPQLGATMSGTAKSVTIDDIIAAEGARIPDAAGSRKQFNIGFVLLTRPGDNKTAALQAIEIVRKVWAGKFAELTQGKGGVANIPALVEITIDTPTDGATVIGPDVSVSGTVINTSGVETGITVNGMPAPLTGNRFVANHVPLQAGGNIVSATATDVNGLAATATRSVTAQAGNHIRLTSNSQWGVAPLDISLSLRPDGSFSIAKLTMTATGSAPVTLTQGTASTEFAAKMVVEGTYTITATVVGSDGETYSDTVTITVVNRRQLENLLKQKWGGMKARIAAVDVNGAVGYFASKPQAKYQAFFAALGAQLPLLNDSLQEIELVDMTDGYAKCRLYRDRTIVGQVHKIEYVIYFIQEKGIWKLRRI